jgi:hypothetical protein
MKIKIKSLLVFAALLCATQSASAYRLYGAGGGSCGEWVSERSSDQWYGKGQWMLGVISAVGYYSVYDLNDIDPQAFAVWMDNYCQKNPLEQFSEGVYALVEELATKKP